MPLMLITRASLMPLFVIERAMPIVAAVRCSVHWFGFSVCRPYCRAAADAGWRHAGYEPAGRERVHYWLLLTNHWLSSLAPNNFMLIGSSPLSGFCRHFGSLIHVSLSLGWSFIVAWLATGLHCLSLLSLVVVVGPSVQFQREFAGFWLPFVWFTMPVWLFSHCPLSRSLIIMVIALSMVRLLSLSGLLYQSLTLGRPSTGSPSITSLSNNWLHSRLFVATVRWLPFRSWFN